MRNIVYMLLLILLVSNSCRNDNRKIISARSFYDSIQKEYSLNKAIQQPVLDSLTIIAIFMKSNPNEKIDTNSFKKYIEDAKLKNIQTISNIKKLYEIDEKINYKSKVLSHLMSINSLYDNELQEFIKILNQDNKEKYIQAAKFLFPKLKLIKQKENEYLAAKNIFNSKYSTESK